jgi:hypothetical protein
LKNPCFVMDMAFYYFISIFYIKIKLAGLTL